MTELRWDPLTGDTARLLRERVPMLPPSDFDLAGLAADTRAGCPFCPERVLAVTPRFPAALVEAGRIEVGAALLFPNLVGFAEHSSVCVYGPELHDLPLASMTAEPVADNLAAHVEIPAGSRVIRAGAAGGDGMEAGRRCRVQRPGQWVGCLTGPVGEPGDQHRPQRRGRAGAPHHLGLVVADDLVAGGPAITSRSMATSRSASVRREVRPSGRWRSRPTARRRRSRLSWATPARATRSRANSACAAEGDPDRRHVVQAPRQRRWGAGTVGPVGGLRVPSGPRARAVTAAARPSSAPARTRADHLPDPGTGQPSGIADGGDAVGEKLAHRRGPAVMDGGRAARRLLASVRCTISWRPRPRRCGAAPVRAPAPVPGPRAGREDQRGAAGRRDHPGGKRWPPHAHHRGHQRQQPLPGSVVDVVVDRPGQQAEQRMVAPVMIAEWLIGQQRGELHEACARRSGAVPTAGNGPTHSAPPTPRQPRQGLGRTSHVTSRTFEPAYP